MKKAIYVLSGLIIGLIFSGGMFWLKNFPAYAEKTSATQFEYCAITNIYIAGSSENQAVINGGANICHFQIGGCQNEEIKSELIYSRFLQDFRLENSEYSKNLALDRAEDEVFSKAVSRLGLDGWEMISTPTFELDNYVRNLQGNYSVTSGSKAIKPDIYFKRLKQ